MLNLQTVAVAALVLSGGMVHAAPVYLWADNMTVSLGSSMSAEPFQNRTTAQSLANAIDLPTAASTELHTQEEHIWVSGGSLELDFDFGQEYDLTTLHFWNYHSESYDVDDIDFRFYDGSRSLVGTLLDIEPRLGNATGSDATPISAEDYALSFPSRVQYVNAIFSGSNNEVDWNNIGFTGELSGPAPDPDVIPLPASALLLFGGLASLGVVRRRRR